MDGKNLRWNSLRWNSHNRDHLLKQKMKSEVNKFVIPITQTSIIDISIDNYQKIRLTVVQSKA